MILTIVLLSMFLAMSVWLNVRVIQKNVQLDDQRESLVDRIEESLDILNECYGRMSHNADIPVMSDEPVIREVVGDIKRARNAILAIAGLVVMYDDNGEAK